MSDEPSIPGGQLRALVERIERLDAEIAERNSDKSEIYQEAKSLGFDVKILRKCIAIRKKDPAALSEEETLIGVYMREIEGPHVHVHVREEAA